MENSSKAPVFNVRRREAELVPPSQPTPKEFKTLSYFDNEESIQMLVPSVGFYPPNPNPNPNPEAGKDPAKVIRDAISKALVFYYPLAGKIREFPHSNPKLVVECTGEGAVFIEADADVTLAQLGDQLHPPYPYLDLIMPQMTDVLNSPLLHFQVTRLKCGGFIVASLYHACMMDGNGVSLFYTAICELARGASQPSILPVWDRHLLSPRTPPRVTCTHHEFEEPTLVPVPLTNMAYRIFYFTHKEISTLRNLLPLNLKNNCTSFELITAFIWRCRTAALQLEPEEQVRMLFAVNVRDRYDPPFPKGFYGNAFVPAGSLTTAGELCINNTLGYAVRLVADVKNNVTEEYMRSFIDGLALRGPSHRPTTLSTSFVSDLRKMGYLDTDFGWGSPVAAGPGVAWYEPFPHEESSYILCKRNKGRDYITVIPMALPADIMDLFEQHIYSTLKIRGIDPFNDNGDSSTTSDNVIKSNL